MWTGLKSFQLITRSPPVWFCFLLENHSCCVPWRINCSHGNMFPFFFMISTGCYVLCRKVELTVAAIEEMYTAPQPARYIATSITFNTNEVYRNVRKLTLKFSSLPPVNLPPWLQFFFQFLNMAGQRPVTVFRMTSKDSTSAVKAHRGTWWFGSKIISKILLT